MNDRMVLKTAVIAVAIWVALSGGIARAADQVFFSTSSGIFVWSSDTQMVQPISNFPSYEIEISPTGVIFVGNGGADSAASGVTTSGIFFLNAAGNAVPFSSLPADDLEFDENGILYASNSQGIFRIEANGTAVQVSTNPTSQFAFESYSTVVTTNGSVFDSVFSSGTDRIDLTTDTTSPITTVGGEDIEVLTDGTILLSGQGGIAEPDLSFVLEGFPVFDFEPTPSGKIYIGNTADYGGVSWPPGLYVLSADRTTLTQPLTDDINSIEVLSPSPIPVCSSGVTTIDGLKAEVDALNTSTQTINTLNATLTNVQAALGSNNKTARSRLENFISEVVNRSNFEEANPNRILLDEANSVICGASNVLIGIPLP